MNYALGTEAPELYFLFKEENLCHDQLIEYLGHMKMSVLVLFWASIFYLSVLLA